MARTNLKRKDLNRLTAYGSVRAGKVWCWEQLTAVVMEVRVLANIWTVRMQRKTKSGVGI